MDKDDRRDGKVLDYSNGSDWWRAAAVGCQDTSEPLCSDVNENRISPEQQLQYEPYWSVPTSLVPLDMSLRFCASTSSQ